MKKIKLFYRIALFVLIICLLSGCAPADIDEPLFNVDTLMPSGKATKLAAPTYPTVAPFPDYSKFDNHEAYRTANDLWSEGQRSRRQSVDGSEAAEFMRRSTKEMLTLEQDKNAVCSPINVYMALSLLAETTDGDSRQQILSLLGAADIGNLREQTGRLWRANYRDDGADTVLMSNALFLRSDFDFEKTALQNAANHHYAELFEGKMGTSKYDKALQAWLNEKTKNRLSDKVQDVKTDAAEYMKLVSTIYFSGKWSGFFIKENNTLDPFHTKNGDKTVEFMHAERYQPYYQSKLYTATCLPFANGGYMWLILPNEDVDVMDVAADEALLDPVLNKNDFNDIRVNLSLPKFDVDGTLDLQPTLKALGVSDIFDSARADFSPLIKDQEAFISSVDHAARVTIDEEGCIAAAFTTISNCGSAMPPPEKVDFTLDRPFIFVIESDVGTPLFAGVVQDPS